jgi:co-chaperonin GroES (HSP10)
MKMIKSITLLAILLSTLANAHTLSLTFHKNNQSLSSGSVVCFSLEHCNYLIKSFEYNNKEGCRMIEVKDGDKVIYRKYYDNY